MALVICCVLLTLRIRRRMSMRAGMAYLTAEDAEHAESSLVALVALMPGYLCGLCALCGEYR
jgi:hypothetical protein